jgi:hypothetical protein
MHESPLKALSAQSELKPADLERQLQELSVRGKTIKDLAGDLEGARMLLKLISMGQLYKPSKEFQENLMQIVYQHLQDPDLDAKERGIWAKIGLEANKQNSAGAEQMLRLMGMWSTKAESNVTVNVNTTIADKVLNIMDPVRGAHSRDVETQEELNARARQLFNSERVQVVSVTQDGIGTPPGVTQDTGRRQVLDAELPGDAERKAGTDDQGSEFTL